MSEAEQGTEEPTFEEALQELERIARRLDREEMPLDEALELFETGVAHLRAASSMLEEARGRVEELVEDAAGEVDAVEFEVPDGDAGDGADG